MTGDYDEDDGWLTQYEVWAMEDEYEASLWWDEQ